MANSRIETRSSKTNNIFGSVGFLGFLYYISWIFLFEAETPLIQRPPFIYHPEIPSIKKPYELRLSSKIKNGNNNTNYYNITLNETILKSNGELPYSLLGLPEHFSGKLVDMPTVNTLGCHSKFLFSSCHTRGDRIPLEWYNNETLEIQCPSSCERSEYRYAYVWGTNPFTLDSSLCRAAAFLGLDSVTAFSVESPEMFSAGEANNVSTLFWNYTYDAFILNELSFSNISLYYPSNKQENTVWLVSRGNCTFARKAIAAKLAGAAAVLIVNYDDEIMNMGAFYNEGYLVDIPVAMVPSSIGEKLRNELNDSSDITLEKVSLKPDFHHTILNPGFGLKRVFSNDSNCFCEECSCSFDVNEIIGLPNSICGSISNTYSPLSFSDEEKLITIEFEFPQVLVPAQVVVWETGDDQGAVHEIYVYDAKSNSYKLGWAGTDRYLCDKTAEMIQEPARFVLTQGLSPTNRILIAFKMSLANIDAVALDGWELDSNSSSFSGFCFENYGFWADGLCRCIDGYGGSRCDKREGFNAFQAVTLCCMLVFLLLFFLLVLYFTNLSIEYSEFLEDEDHAHKSTGDELKQQNGAETPEEATEKKSATNTEEDKYTMFYFSLQSPCIHTLPVYTHAILLVLWGVQLASPLLDSSFGWTQTGFGNLTIKFLRVVTFNFVQEFDQLINFLISLGLLFLLPLITSLVSLMSGSEALSKWFSSIAFRLSFGAVFVGIFGHLTSDANSNEIPSTITSGPTSSIYRSLFISGSFRRGSSGGYYASIFGGIIFIFLPIYILFSSTLYNPSNRKFYNSLDSRKKGNVLLTENSSSDILLKYFVIIWTRIGTLLFFRRPIFLLITSILGTVMFGFCTYKFPPFVIGNVNYLVSCVPFFVLPFVVGSVIALLVDDITNTISISVLIVLLVMTAVFVFFHAKYYFFVSVNANEPGSLEEKLMFDKKSQQELERYREKVVQETILEWLRNLARVLVIHDRPSLLTFLSTQHPVVCFLHIFEPIDYEELCNKEWGRNYINLSSKYGLHVTKRDAKQSESNDAADGSACDEEKVAACSSKTSESNTADQKINLEEEEEKKSPFFLVDDFDTQCFELEREADLIPFVIVLHYLDPSLRNEGNFLIDLKLPDDDDGSDQKSNDLNNAPVIIQMTERVITSDKQQGFSSTNDFLDAASYESKDIKKYEEQQKRRQTSSPILTKRNPILSLTTDLQGGSFAFELQSKNENDGDGKGLMARTKSFQKRKSEVNNERVYSSLEKRIKYYRLWEKPLWRKLNEWRKNTIRSHFKTYSLSKFFLKLCLDVFLTVKLFRNGNCTSSLNLSRFAPAHALFSFFGFLFMCLAIIRAVTLDKKSYFLLIMRISWIKTFFSDIPLLIIMSLVYSIIGPSEISLFSFVLKVIDAPKEVLRAVRSIKEKVRGCFARNLSLFFLALLMGYGFFVAIISIVDVDFSNLSIGIEMRNISISVESVSSCSSYNSSRISVPVSDSINLYISKWDYDGFSMSPKESEYYTFSGGWYDEVLDRNCSLHASVILAAVGNFLGMNTRKDTAPNGITVRGILLKYEKGYASTASLAYVEDSESFYQTDRFESYEVESSRGFICGGASLLVNEVQSCPNIGWCTSVPILERGSMTEYQDGLIRLVSFKAFGKWKVCEF